MFKKSPKGYYFWEEFAKLGVVNGFSTKEFGDMNIKNTNYSLSLKKLCKALGIDKKQTIGMEQVHGYKVSFVSDKNSDSVVVGADGLISLNSNVFLLCRTADCAPVLFVDKKKGIFGIAHAGWRGAYKAIVKVMLSKMIEIGAKCSDIIVGIGPSIRACCYSIDEDRAKLFADTFPDWEEKILKKKDSDMFLDLQTLIKLQLIDSGVLGANIKDSMLCTKDNVSDLYSFRAERGKDSFGHFIAVIGKR